MQHGACWSGLVWCLHDCPGLSVIQVRAPLPLESACTVPCGVGGAEPAWLHVPQVGNAGYPAKHQVWKANPEFCQFCLLLSNSPTPPNMQLLLISYICFSPLLLVIYLTPFFWFYDLEFPFQATFKNFKNISNELIFGTTYQMCRCNSGQNAFFDRHFLK